MRLPISFLFRRPRSAVQCAHDKAHAGEAQAQFDLGCMFAEGAGVAQDLLQAAHWYSLAADQHYSMAEFNLGLLFASGHGVARDAGKANALFSKAAAQGNSGAQYQLGLREQLASYRTGATVECKVEAYKWFRLASAQGYPGSIGAFEQVALALTREQVLEGDRRANSYLTTITRQDRPI